MEEPKFGGEGFKAHGHDDFEAEERDMIIVAY
jgi:hypothetical protein